MTYNDDIDDPNYSIFTAYNFFIGGDYVRVIILLYILFSTILNLLIIVSIIITKKKLAFVSKITLSIMLINYIHTISYLYQWVIKIPGKTRTIGEEKDRTVVGLLLTGNPNNMGACQAQAFCLISSSISQDFLINTVFFLINKTKIPNIAHIWIGVLIVAFIVPFAFTLFLLLFGALGINDRFCYINKYIYKGIGNDKTYEIYTNFRLFVTVVYGIRTINLLFSLLMFFNIIKYVMSKKMKLTYIFKMAFILLVQLVTITIGIIYRISSYFSKKFSANFSGPYLILNTIDGVLFPLSFIITNGIHRILYKKITGKSLGEEEEEAQYPNIDEDDDDDDNGERGKSIQMTEFSITDDNIDNNDNNENTNNFKIKKNSEEITF